jgi:peptide/nickel transport system permease protein
MSDPTTSGDREVSFSGGAGGEGTGGSVSVNAPDTVQAAAPTAVVGRSPGQLAWMRLRRDRVAMVSAVTLVVFFVIVLLSFFGPLISWLYGDGPAVGHSELLDDTGDPLGTAGGVSGAHWLGLTPSNGYDLLLQLIFGTRTSLIIAVVSSVLGVAIGTVVGVVSGYAGGWIDRLLVWFTDLMLAFPFFLFTIALVPTLSTRLQDQYGEVAVWKREAVLIAIFVIFGWMGTARLVRGQVISLREREYVEAARAAGASASHIVFRQILPNTWAPILVTFSLSVPITVTAEAALSFLSIGITEPTPDLGRLIFNGVSYLSDIGYAPLFVLLPGITIFVLVLAFNLLGDSLRDALDPKSVR